MTAAVEDTDDYSFSDDDEDEGLNYQREECRVSPTRHVSRSYATLYAQNAEGA